ncbi:hypothetical protein KAURM247S_00927 [Kitasatospora aureofaciens]
MPSWRAHSRVATTHRKLCAMPSAARASRQAGSGSRSRCRSGTRSPDRHSGLRSCAPVTGPLDGLIAGRICDVRHSAWWGSSGCCEGGGGGVDGGPFGAVAGPSGDGLVIGGEPVDGLVVDGEVGASLADGCPVHGRSRGRRPHRAHGGRHRVRRRPAGRRMGACDTTHRPHVPGDTNLLSPQRLSEHPGGPSSVAARRRPARSSSPARSSRAPGAPTGPLPPGDLAEQLSGSPRRSPREAITPSRMNQPAN